MPIRSLAGFTIDTPEFSFRKRQRVQSAPNQQFGRPKPDSTPPRLRKQRLADGSLSENPLDLVWLIAGAIAAVFGIASLVPGRRRGKAPGRRLI